MSGRTLHLRDGELITNRKTDRRNPRRDPREKLLDVAKAGPDKFPIRLVFRLPKTLEGFVAAGMHGLNVQALSGGMIRIGAASSEQCFIAARAFFEAIARDRPAFTTSCIIISADNPEQRYCRYLTVVRGDMVVSAGGLIEPKIYQAA